ncbi:MAG: hypothetical protein V4616_04220, partial [Bacteroidota bacterium]
MIYRSLLLLVAVMSCVLAFSQQAGSVLSGNSKFVARYTYKGKDKASGTHEYAVKVYSVAYNSLIQEI